MKAVHFGAGNIGRGFIGETLAANDFSINFVDVNDVIINALNQKHMYDINLAASSHKSIHVENVSGINNKTEPEKVINAIKQTDLITTAIGPKILPVIAPLIAKGISARAQLNLATNLDIIACENMIGGSQYLKKEVYRNLSQADMNYATTHIGFPNAAVDRIVPLQHHDDPLAVSVEPFKEWIVDESQMIRPDIKLKSVNYVSDLEPYIERKLFSVNTGHATVAYTGKYYKYTTIGKAITDSRILKQLKGVLGETGELLVHKWNFTAKDIKNYQNKVIKRFQNPYISDDVSRVARTPIRKLGYNERFIRPIRELKKSHLDYKYLLDTVGMIFTYDEPTDTESVELQKSLKDMDLKAVIKSITGLTDQELINEIVVSYQSKQ